MRRELCEGEVCEEGGMGGGRCEEGGVRREV